MVHVLKSGAYVQPSRGDVHINQPLTNISVAFMQSAMNFVAGRVFPIIPSPKQSNAYFTYPRGYFNRDQMEERLPGTLAAEATYAIEQDTFYAKVYAIRKAIPDQVRGNADSPIMLDREATEWVTMQGLIRRESDFVGGYFRNGVWTYRVDGAASSAVTTFANLDFSDNSNNNVLYWNDGASTPIENVRLAKQTVLRSTGFMPNILTLARPVYDVLLDHPDIIARLDRGQTPGGSAMASRESLAALFELDEVLVMDAIVNRAEEGAADDHQFFNENGALLTYRPMMPGIMTPSAGYTFAWTGADGGFMGGSMQGNRIKRYREEAYASDWIENQLTFDHKLIAADMGVYFNGIIQ